MRILVFDDSEVHRRAAEIQLADHDLTVVSTYEEAEKAVTVYLDETALTAYVDQKIERGEEYDFDEVCEKFRTHPNFDVVLTDLLVPAGMRAQRVNSKHVGTEMPLGIFIGLMAARNGVKYVAVFTDSDHHDHPASACFDDFCPSTRPTPFIVEGARVILSNVGIWVDDVEPDNLTVKVSWQERSAGKPSVRAKNWRKALEYLLNPEGEAK